MDLSRFDKLEKKYAQHASWAIWNPNDPEDTAIIRENLADLKGSVVMVALNISDKISREWGNFHGRDHARKLMYAFNRSAYRGAYMTDLIKNYVEPKSEELRKRLSAEDERSHLESFRGEMADLGANQRTLFILFGDEVTKRFKRHLADKYPDWIKCPHYSMWGKGYSDTEWVRKVWLILEENSRASQPFSINAAMRTDFADLSNRIDRARRQRLGHSPPQ